MHFHGRPKKTVGPLKGLPPIGQDERVVTSSHGNLARGALAPDGPGGPRMAGPLNPP